MIKLVLRKILRIIYPISKAYWYVTRPESIGAKCLVLNGGNVLLIRQSFSPSWWSLPGGRVKRNELPVEAVKRELTEEVGLSIEPEFLRVLKSEREYKKDTIYLFVSHIDVKEVFIDNMEVIEAKWFPLDSLPENLGWLVRKGLELYRSVKNIKDGP